ncbi:MAG: hypothetical protein ACRC80_22075 [Waterburya sp.]
MLSIITIANYTALTQIMTDTPNFSSTEEEYKNNVDLSYEYIEKSLKEVQDISHHTNTQLGLIIGFNFTFIRFFLSELPDNVNSLESLPCNSCLLFKILAYAFAIASIISGFLGLYTKIKYYIISPNDLIASCNQINNLELRLAIVDTWDEKLGDFIKLAKQKKQLFNYSIIFLLLSGLIAALDEIIATVFY